MKKRIITLLLMVFVMVLNTKAQNIFIKFKDGTSTEYALSSVRKISFSGTDMLLTKTDNTVLTWATNDIAKYFYGLTTNIAEQNTELDRLDVLIYPNPSNGDFNIDFSLLENKKTNISIMSVDGKLIETVLSKKINKGNYSINWQNKNLKSGNYFIKIQTDNQITTKKLIILK